MFFQRTAELRHNPEQLQVTVEMVFRRLVALGLMPTIVLILNGQRLFSLVFGSQSGQAGIYAQILGVWLFFLFIKFTNGNFFHVLEKQEQALVAHALILCSRLAALIIGGRTKHLFDIGALVREWNICLWRIDFFGPLRMAGSSSRFMAKVVTRYVFYTLPLAIILFLSSWYLPDQTIVNLVLTVILTGVYYLLVLRQEPALRQFALDWFRRRFPQSNV